MVDYYGGDMENISDDWGYDPNYDWGALNEPYAGPIETTWDQNWQPAQVSQEAPRTPIEQMNKVFDQYPATKSNSSPMPTFSGGSGGGSPQASQGYSRATGPGWDYEMQQAQLNEQMRQFNERANAQRTSALQGGGGLVNLVNEYNRSYAQARYDYDQRYNQMLGIADATTSQQQADVRARYAGQRASGMQNLQRLGMANTTLASTQQQGLQRGESEALNRLADIMQQTKLGIIGSKKTAQELAPSRDVILAALAQGQNAAGPYGGQLTKALGALDQGLSPLPYDPNAGTQIGGPVSGGERDAQATTRLLSGMGD